MKNLSHKRDNQVMREIAEALTVENELKSKTRNNLEATLHNIDILNRELAQSNDRKRKALEQIQNSRESKSQEFLSKKISQLNSVPNKKLDLIDVEGISTPEIYQDWDTAVISNRKIAELYGIDLSNPYLSMFSNVEQVQIAKDLTNKFDLIKLDKYDYLFATGCGLIAGFIDAMFVGTITSGTNATGFQKGVDNVFDKLVTKVGKNERLAELEQRKSNAKTPESKARWEKEISCLKKDVAIDKYGNEVPWSKKDSIKTLEKNHRVSYDAGTNKAVKGMTLDDHHLRSLAHDPGPIGLIFGIYNQISGVSSFLDSNGKYISVVTGNQNNELSGNLVQKIVQATNNWFFHCLSDVAGSSNSVGRGSGLPVPGWVALQKLQFGSFNLNSQQQGKNIAEISDWMFKNGYDLRAFTAQSIPVIIYEVLLRCYWFCKQYFYYGKSLKESIPIANSRELARLLLFSAGSFSTVDVLHATIKSKPGSPTFLASFLMTVNIPGLLNLGFRSFQNIRNEVRHRKQINNILDEDLKKEFDRIIYEAPV